MEGPIKNEDKKPKDQEIQLSPEVLEGVMEKITDINSYGTAYTIISRGMDKGSDRDRLRGILSRGLGIAGRCVFFNIVGRTCDMRKSDMEIKNSHWFKTYDPEKMAIAFTLEGLKELSSEPKKGNKKGNYGPDPIGFRWTKDFLESNYRIKDITNAEGIRKHHKFDEFREGLFDETGKIKVSSDFGFVLSGNIEQKRFRGIVVQNMLNEDLIDFIVNEMTRKSNPLPIYDPDGNLIWPKQMSYEEVKKFVEERDKEKEDGEKRDKKEY